MSNILESLKVSFVIIGTIIGAGFASGQEIYTFFNVYGLKGLLGIFISCMLIGIVIYKTLKISMQLKQEEYEDFLKSIIPEKLRDNKRLIFTINNIINIFLLISFFIMVSGFASYFFQEFQASKIYGGIIIAVIYHFFYRYTYMVTEKWIEIIVVEIGCVYILFLFYVTHRAKKLVDG